MSTIRNRTIFVLSLLTLLTSSLFAMSSKPSSSSPKGIIKEQDQTDTYAIPLDSSEEEENEEMKELKREQENYQKRHPQAVQPTAPRR